MFESMLAASFLAIDTRDRDVSVVHAIHWKYIVKLYSRGKN